MKTLGRRTLPLTSSFRSKPPLHTHGDNQLSFARRKTLLRCAVLQQHQGALVWLNPATTLRFLSPATPHFPQAPALRCGHPEPRSARRPQQWQPAVVCLPCLPESPSAILPVVMMKPSDPAKHTPRAYRPGVPASIRSPGYSVHLSTPVALPDLVPLRPQQISRMETQPGRALRHARKCRSLSPSTAAQPSQRSECGSMLRRPAARE